MRVQLPSGAYILRVVVQLVERRIWDAKVRWFKSGLPDITFFRGVVGSTQEFDSCRLGPSPGGRNKAKVVPIKKGYYWFESNISSLDEIIYNPLLIWAVRITVYYVGFARLK